MLFNFLLSFFFFSIIYFLFHVSFLSLIHLHLPFPSLLFSLSILSLSTFSVVLFVCISLFPLHHISSHFSFLRLISKPPLPSHPFYADGIHKLFPFYTFQSALIFPLLFSYSFSSSLYSCSSRNDSQ